MNKAYFKPIVFGFSFGTIGMYVLAMLALISRPIESFISFLYAPGRFVAERFVGSEGTTLEVLLLLLFNGILYALIFLLMFRIAGKIKKS